MSLYSFYILIHVIRRRTVLYGKVYTVYASTAEVTNILQIFRKKKTKSPSLYEGWNFNSGNYLFTTDTK